MFNLPPKIILFDTEYTTWEGAQARNWGGPNEYREIVEIGAIKIETETPEFKEMDSFLCCVKPVKNPILSDYIVNLTGITQETIDTKGLNLAEAVNKFYEWSAGEPLYSWGLDGDVLSENYKLINVDFLFTPDRFNDLRDIFSSRGIDAKNYMSSTIIEAFGEQQKRIGHDGLNDARTLSDGLRLLAKSTINLSV